MDEARLRGLRVETHVQPGRTGKGREEEKERRRRRRRREGLRERERESRLLLAEEAEKKRR